MQQDIELKPFTTFKIGGKASYLASIRSREDLSRALQFARKRRLPWLVLGGGSNIVVPDEGYQGVVLKMEIEGIEWSELPDGAVRVTAGAGEAWDHLVATAVARGWYGLENLSFIPGTVGAAPIQNIGAYGVEVCHVIEWVEVFDVVQQSFEILSAASCQFEYRSSIFKDLSSRQLIVVRVGFKLARRGTPNLGYKDVAEYFSGAKRAPTLMEVRHAIGEIRSRKFPDLLKFGTAGSYFKNPVLKRSEALRLQARFPELPVYTVDAVSAKIPLAWVLDRVLGLKGFRRGAVGTFERQPLVLVNFGGATAQEVFDFADMIASRVRDETRVEIIPEVVRITS